MLPRAERVETHGEVAPFALVVDQRERVLIEAKDLDEALDLAARVPSAKMGTIEVRPLVEVSVPAPA